MMKQNQYESGTNVQCTKDQELPDAAV